MKTSKKTHYKTLNTQVSYLNLVMATSSGISTISPLIFTGENYHAWSVKMQAYLKGLLLWEAVETEMETSLPDNPSLN